MKKSVIVMGKGSLAIKISRWFMQSSDYELLCVVPVIPEPAWTESFLSWAKSVQVPAIESGHYKDIPGVHNDNWSVDLVFSVFYDRIIKPWFINKCKRILNIHNGPLPKYRGVAPINWALKNNEIQHGVTIHEVTEGIDDGPIVAQLIYSIYPEFDEVIDVYNRALNYAWVLFEQTMPILDKIKARPQDHTMATYYSKQDSYKLGERRDFTIKKSLGISNTTQGE
jgi:methionyl-tRNA formyltransferase